MSIVKLKGFCKPIIIITIIFIIVTVLAFFFPQSVLAQLINYYNGISSIGIMALTTIYVITTSKQLESMNKQLNVMKDNTNLQLQPLPIPKLQNVRLEQIKAYLTPEDSFTSIHIIYRCMFDYEFKNVGSGAALNLFIFSQIETQKGKDLTIPVYGQSHCVSEKDAEGVVVSGMILDQDYVILENLIGNTLKLKTDIYYKNVFGIGFHEQVSHSLLMKDESHDKAKEWKKFLREEVNKYELDIKRHEALSHKVPDDANKIFHKIKEEIEARFTDDILIFCVPDAKSYNVEIVNFEESVNNAMNNFHISVEKYNPWLAKKLIAASKS